MLSAVAAVAVAARVTKLYAGAIDGWEGPTGETLTNTAGQAQRLLPSGIHRHHTRHVVVVVVKSAKCIISGKTGGECASSKATHSVYIYIDVGTPSTPSPVDATPPPPVCNNNVAL